MTTTPTAPPGTMPAPVGTRKLSAGWTGIVMIIGAVVAAVGAFLPWEKLDVFDDGGDFFGGVKLSALSQTASGNIDQDALKPGGAGVTILVAAAVLIVTGLLIALRKGRLWTSIVGLLFALAAMSVGAANFGAAESDAKEILNSAPEGFSVDAVRDIGVLVTTVGGGIAVIGAILALVRRRQV